jgi:hypothetical protein
MLFIRIDWPQSKINNRLKRNKIIKASMKKKKESPKNLIPK